ncbi:MAG: GDP-mannose 4,6-dehydratase [Candidatus Anstonellales archaeon]
MYSFADFYRGKRILITGGLGFIGSNLSIRLCQFGSKVHILNKKPTNPSQAAFNIEPVKNQVIVTYSDTNDFQTLDECVQEKDIIFHLAGRGSHVDSILDPIGDASANALSALYLLKSIIKKEKKPKIIYSGTRGQYGNAKTLPVNEDHPKQPVDINGINKQAAEDYLLLYSRIGAIRACSLRMGNIYGPRMQMQNPNQGFISWFIRLAIDNKCLNVFGSGSQRRDFTYIDDLIDALLLCGMSDSTDSEAYNVGGDVYSVLEVAKLIVEVAGSGSVSITPYAEGHKKVEVGDFVPDVSKINKLGWKPKTPFKEGLKMTIDYYRKYKEFYW